MADHPDSLIARSSARSSPNRLASWHGLSIASGDPWSDPYRRQLADLDFWLRCDGHRRNPGTTADLIAAGLFVLLRLNLIPQPFR